MKYFIISQPKAGTYLLSNLLQNLGIEQTYLHFSETKYEKYDSKNLIDAKFNPSKYSSFLDFNESINLINENQFGVGHLSYTERNQKILKSFKKILLLRDYDEIVKSWKRFTSETGRTPKLNKKFYQSIENWKIDPDVFIINFHDIISINCNVIDHLQHFLFSEIRFDSMYQIKIALEKNSLTKSSIRS